MINTISTINGIWTLRVRPLKRKCILPLARKDDDQGLDLVVEPEDEVVDDDVILLGQPFQAQPSPRIQCHPL